MSLARLIPQIKKLSYSDKLLLLQSLAKLLLEDNGLVPPNDQAVTTPQGLHDSFEAAAILAKALAEEAPRAEESLMKHG